MLDSTPQQQPSKKRWLAIYKNCEQINNFILANNNLDNGK